MIDSEVPLTISHPPSERVHGENGGEKSFQAPTLESPEDLAKLQAWADAAAKNGMDQANKTIEEAKSGVGHPDIDAPNPMQLNEEAHNLVSEEHTPQFDLSSLSTQPVQLAQSEVPTQASSKPKGSGIKDFFNNLAAQLRLDKIIDVAKAIPGKILQAVGKWWDVSSPKPA